MLFTLNINQIYNGCHALPHHMIQCNYLIFCLLYFSIIFKEFIKMIILIHFTICLKNIIISQYINIV